MAAITTVERCQTSSSRRGLARKNVDCRRHSSITL
uniref:Uncharacterized protein n=1 Tax=Anguilla anguilla TaxID=7936 RepID=A0A0E9V081_ANGAN